MITTVTKKPQITIRQRSPIALDSRAGPESTGSLTSKSDEIRCIVLPEPSVIAASLRAAGKRFLKPGQDPGAALLAKRPADESIRSAHLQ